MKVADESNALGEGLSIERCVDLFGGWQLYSKIKEVESIFS